MKKYLNLDTTIEVMAIVVIAIIFGLVSEAFGQEATRVEQATVRVGGCSGVVVAPGDLVLSANHCGFQPVEKIVFADGDSATGKLVAAPNRGEGAVAFRFSPPRNEFLQVATVPPAPGDSVTAIGHPSGKGITIARGRTLKSAEKWYYFPSSVSVSKQAVSRRGEPGIPFPALVADIFSASGMSGGPLLNDREEVVGLISAENVFVDTGTLHKALALANGGKAQQAEIVVITTSDCVHCRPVKADIKAGKFSPHRVTLLELDESTGQWSDPELLQEYLAATGNRQIDAPTFWYRGTSAVRVGYSGGSRGVLGWIANTLQAIAKGIVTFFVGDPPDTQVTPIVVSDDRGEPTPAPLAADFAGVTLVLSVPTIFDGVKGKIASLIGPMATGEAERIIRDKTDGKARLVVLLERNEPVRHQEFVAAMRIPREQVTLTAFVPQRDLGLVKGLIAKKIENEIIPRLEGTLLSVVPERTSAGDYANGLSILDRVIEPEGDPLFQERPPPEVTEEGIVERLKPSIVEAVKSHLPATVVEKVEAVSEVRQAWRDGGIGAVLVLLVGGFARNWYLGRKLKPLIEKQE